MEGDANTGRPGDSDTGAGLHRTRKSYVNLAVAFALIGFGVNIALDVMDRVRSSEDVVRRIGENRATIKPVPESEYKEFRKNVEKILDQHDKDIREMRVVLLNWGRK